MAGRIAALRAYLMVFRADMRRAAELCHQALSTCQRVICSCAAIVAWILSLVRLDDGDLQDGKRALEEVAG